MGKKKRKLSAWQKHVKSYMATHKGLSFKEALPKAKLTYHKSGGNPGPRALTVKAPRKVKRKMSKKKRRRSRSMTIPLAPIIGLIGAPAIHRSIDGLMKGDLKEATYYLPNLVGIWNDGTFHMNTLLTNLTPIAAGLLIHKFVGGSPLNLNRTLGRARVPFLRI